MNLDARLVHLVPLSPRSLGPCPPSCNLKTVACSGHHAHSFISKPESKRQHHDRGLLLIAVYKLFHALLFIAIGFGAHRLLHKDIADQIESLARYLRFNPESHLVNFILDESLAP